MTAGSLGPIDHVAVVVRDIDDALPRYAALFGLAAPEGVRAVEAQGVRLCFLPTGEPPAARIEGRMFSWMRNSQRKSGRLRKSLTWST